MELFFDHKFKTLKKLLCYIVLICFSWQQLAYGIDFSQLTTQTPGAKAPGVCAGEIEVTNYDLFAYEQDPGIIPGLMRDSRDQEQTGMSASRFEKATKQKSEQVLWDNFLVENEGKLLLDNDKKKRDPATVPLKRKQGGEDDKLPPARGIYYTLEDYNTEENPMQLNAYIYEGGAFGGALLEIISYDISGLETGIWTGPAEEIETEDGDTFTGSYELLTGLDFLIEERIISRTIFFGAKGEERIDYILSDYDEEGAPWKVTIYDYDMEGNGSPDNLDETRTYNVWGLDIDFDSDDTDWKEFLTDDRITQRAVYEGSKDDERISYVLDSYLINDDQTENNPHRITLYDYDVDGDDALDETRTYCIAGLTEDEWFTEELDRLESLSVYTGEKDKERIEYTLSSYFPEYYEEDAEDSTAYLDSEGAMHIPPGHYENEYGNIVLYPDQQEAVQEAAYTALYQSWERTDYFYEDGALVKTETYDISGLDAEEAIENGTGILVETTFFHGDPRHERIDYSCALYDEEGNPQIKADYIYEGRALRSIETYDVTGTELDNRDTLLEETLYEGKAGRERALSAMSYYPGGAVLTETTYTYGLNERGIYYQSNITSEEYSLEGELIGRTEITNDLMYGDGLEDQNGNVRHQNIKTYYIDGDTEKLDREEDVILSNYAAKNQAGFEERTSYVYNKAGEKEEVGYQEITNQMFNSDGKVIKQTIDTYSIGEDGSRQYENTIEIENRKFDYYGNILDRKETIWNDKEKTELLWCKTIESEYDNLLARRRGNASLSTATRYDSLEESEDHIIDQTFNETTLFNGSGYAVDMTSITYVMDNLTNPTDPVLKLATESVVHNESIDSHGNAGTQYITTYRTDGSGLESSLGVVSYQVVTNHEFDSQHNALSQSILTYNSEGGELLNVRDITSTGFHTSGVALQQTIITYSDEAREDFLSATVIDNNNIDTFGNIGESTLTRYEDENLTIALDRSVITTNTFDPRGNALNQTIEQYVYNPDSGQFEWVSVVNAEYQYEFHSFVIWSDITTRVALNQNDTHTARPPDAELTLSHKVVNDMTYETIPEQEFDRFGNARYQSIDSSDWIVDGNGNGDWQQMEDTLRENNLETVDSSGRVINYHDTTVTADAPDLVTETDVTVVQFDYHGRPEIIETTIHRFGSIINEEGEVETLDETLTVTTHITEYDSFGRALRMTRIIDDGVKITTEVDLEDREYDQHGRLVYSKVQVTEIGGNLNKTYTRESSVTKFDYLGRALRTTQITTDGDKVTTESDIEDRRYDAAGRLIYSNVEVQEGGGNLDHTYSVKLEIMGYNTFGQVLKLERTIRDGDEIITNTDLWDREYDEKGRLTSSFVEVHEGGGNLDHTYTVKTEITSYNALGQALRVNMTTVDGARTITETDESDRVYDSQGRLTNSYVKVTESGQANSGSLNHTYWVYTEIQAYNSLGQVTRMMRNTYAGGDVNSFNIAIVEIDEADRAYDSQGRLTNSYTKIIVQDNPVTGAGSLYHTYWVYTEIQGYNSLGQITRMMRNTYEGGDVNSYTSATVEIDESDRVYDSQGRLTNSYTKVIESDPSGSLYHTYWVYTEIQSYNDLGQVLRMKRITYEGGDVNSYGKATIEEDSHNRIYDAQGRLAWSHVNITERGEGLEHTYSVNMFNSYNSLDQITRATIITRDGDSQTVEVDLEPRRYDTNGRLVYSNVQFTETGNGIDRTYTVETTINSYNSAGQMDFMTTVTTIGNKIITTYMDNTTYNINGQMTGYREITTNNLNGVMLINNYQNITYNPQCQMVSYVQNGKVVSGSLELKLPTVWRITTKYNTYGNATYYHDITYARVGKMHASPLGDLAVTNTEWWATGYSDGGNGELESYETRVTDTSGQTTITLVKILESNTQGEVLRDATREWRSPEYDSEGELIDDGEDGAAQDVNGDGWIFTSSFNFYDYDELTGQLAARKTNSSPEGGDPTNSSSVYLNLHNGETITYTTTNKSGSTDPDDITASVTTTNIDGSSVVETYFNGDNGVKQYTFMGREYAGMTIIKYDVMGTKRYSETWFEWSDSGSSTSPVHVTGTLDGEEIDSTESITTHWSASGLSHVTETWNACGVSEGKRDDSNSSSSQSADYGSLLDGMCAAAEVTYETPEGFNSSSSADFLLACQDLDAEISLNGVDISEDIANFNVDTPGQSMRAVVDLNAIVLYGERATDEEYKEWVAAYGAGGTGLEYLRMLDTYIYNVINELIRNNIIYAEKAYKLSFNLQYGMGSCKTLELYEDKRNDEWVIKEFYIVGGIVARPGGGYDKVNIHEKYNMYGECTYRNNRTSTYGGNGKKIARGGSTLRNVLLDERGHVIEADEHTWQQEAEKKDGNFFKKGSRALTGESGTHWHTVYNYYDHVVYDRDSSGKLTGKHIDRSGSDDVRGRIVSWHIDYAIHDERIHVGDGEYYDYDMSETIVTGGGDVMHNTESREPAGINGNGQLTGYVLTTTTTGEVDGEPVNEHDVYRYSNIQYNEHGMITYEEIDHTYSGENGVTLREKMITNYIYAEDGVTLLEVKTEAWRPGATEHITDELWSIYNSNPDLQEMFDESGNGKKGTVWKDKTLVDWAKEHARDNPGSLSDYAKYGTIVHTVTTREITAWTWGGKAFAYTERTENLDAPAGTCWSVNEVRNMQYNALGSVRKQASKSWGHNATGSSKGFDSVWRTEHLRYNAAGRLTYKTRGDRDSSHYTRTWYTHDEYGNVTQTKVRSGSTKANLGVRVLAAVLAGSIWGAIIALAIVNNSDMSHKETSIYDSNGLVIDQHGTKGLLEHKAVEIIEYVVDFIVMIVCEVLRDIVVLAWLAAIIAAVYAFVKTMGEAFKQAATYGNVSWESLVATFVVEFAGTLAALSGGGGAIKAEGKELIKQGVKETFLQSIKQTFANVVRSMVNFVKTVINVVMTPLRLAVDFIKSSVGNFVKKTVIASGVKEATKKAAKREVIAKMVVERAFRNLVQQVLSSLYSEDLNEFFKEELGCNDAWANFWTSVSLSLASYAVSSPAINPNSPDQFFTGSNWLLGENDATIWNSKEAVSGLDRKTWVKAVIGSFKAISLDIASFLPISGILVNAMTGALKSTAWRELQKEWEVIVWDKQKGEWIQNEDADSWAILATKILPEVGNLAETITGMMEKHRNERLQTALEKGNAAEISEVLKDLSSNIKDVTVAGEGSARTVRLEFESGLLLAFALDVATNKMVCQNAFTTDGANGGKMEFDKGASIIATGYGMRFSGMVTVLKVCDMGKRYATFLSAEEGIRDEGTKEERSAGFNIIGVFKNSENGNLMLGVGSRIMVNAGEFVFTANDILVNKGEFAIEVRGTEGTNAIEKGQAGFVRDGEFCVENAASIIINPTTDVRAMLSQLKGKSIGEASFKDDFDVKSDLSEVAPFAEAGGTPREYKLLAQGDLGTYGKDATITGLYLNEKDNIVMHVTGKQAFTLPKGTPDKNEKGGVVQDHTVSKFNLVKQAGNTFTVNTEGIKDGLVEYMFMPVQGKGLQLQPMAFNAGATIGLPVGYEASGQRVIENTATVEINEKGEMVFRAGSKLEDATTGIRGEYVVEKDKVVFKYDEASMLQVRGKIIEDFKEKMSETIQLEALSTIFKDMLGKENVTYRELVDVISGNADLEKLLNSENAEDIVKAVGYMSLTLQLAPELNDAAIKMSKKVEFKALADAFNNNKNDGRTLTYKILGSILAEQAGDVKAQYALKLGLGPKAGLKDIINMLSFVSTAIKKAPALNAMAENISKKLGCKAVAEEYDAGYGKLKFINNRAEVIAIPELNIKIVQGAELQLDPISQAAKLTENGEGNMAGRMMLADTTHSMGKEADKITLNKNIPEIAIKLVEKDGNLTEVHAFLGGTEFKTTKNGRMYITGDFGTVGEVKLTTISMLDGILRVSADSVGKEFTIAIPQGKGGKGESCATGPDYTNYEAKKDNGSSRVITGKMEFAFSGNAFRALYNSEGATWVNKTGTTLFIGTTPIKDGAEVLHAFNGIFAVGEAGGVVGGVGYAPGVDENGNIKKENGKTVYEQSGFMIYYTEEGTFEFINRQTPYMKRVYKNGKLVQETTPTINKELFGKVDTFNVTYETQENGSVVRKYTNTANPEEYYRVDAKGNVLERSAAYKKKQAFRINTLRETIARIPKEKVVEALRRSAYDFGLLSIEAKFDKNYTEQSKYKLYEKKLYKLAKQYEDNKITLADIELEIACVQGQHGGLLSKWFDRGKVDPSEKVREASNYNNLDPEQKQLVDSIACFARVSRYDEAYIKLAELAETNPNPTWINGFKNWMAEGYATYENETYREFGKNVGIRMANVLATGQGIVGLVINTFEDLTWTSDENRVSTKLIEGTVMHYHKYFSENKGGLAKFEGICDIAIPSFIAVLVMGKTPGAIRFFNVASGMRGAKLMVDNKGFIFNDELTTFEKLEGFTNATIMLAHGVLGFSKFTGLTRSLLISENAGVTTLTKTGQALVKIVVLYRTGKASFDLGRSLRELSVGHYSDANKTRGLAICNAVVSVVHILLSFAACLGASQNPELTKDMKRYSANWIKATVAQGFAGGIAITPELIVGSRYVTNPIMSAMESTGAWSALIEYGSQHANDLSLADNDKGWGGFVAGCKLLFAQKFANFMDQVKQTSIHLEKGGFDSMSYTAVYGAMFRILPEKLTGNFMFSKVLGFDVGGPITNGLFDEIFRENFFSAFILEPGFQAYGMDEHLASAIAEQLSELISGAGEGQNAPNTSSNNGNAKLSKVDQFLDKCWNRGSMDVIKNENGKITIKQSVNTLESEKKNVVTAIKPGAILVGAGTIVLGIGLVAGSVALGGAIFNPVTMTVSGSRMAGFAVGLGVILSANSLLKHESFNINGKSAVSILKGTGAKIKNVVQKIMAKIREKMPEAPKAVKVDVKAGKITGILQKQGIAEPKQELVNLLAIQNKSLDNEIELKEAYLKLQRKSGFSIIGALIEKIKPGTGTQAAAKAVRNALADQNIEDSVIGEVAGSIAERVEESHKGKLKKGQEIAFELGNEAMSYEVKEEGLTLMDVVEGLVAENQLPKAASKSLKSKFKDGIVPYEVSYEVRKHKDGSVEVKYSNRAGINFDKKGNLTSMTCTESFSHDDIEKYQSGEIEVIARGHTEPVKSAANTRDAFAMNVRKHSVYGYALPEIIFEKTGKDLINTKVLTASDVAIPGFATIGADIAQSIKSRESIKIDGIKVEGTDEAVELTVKSVVSEGAAAISIADFEEGLRKALMEEGLLPPLPDIPNPVMPPVGAGGFALQPEPMSKTGSSAIVDGYEEKAEDPEAYGIVAQKMESQGIAGNIYLVLPIDSACDAEGNAKPNTGLKDMTKGFNNTNVYIIVKNEADEARFDAVKRSMNLTSEQGKRFNKMELAGKVNTESVMHKIGIDNPAYLAIGMIDSANTRANIQTDLQTRGLKSASFLIEGKDASYSANASVIAVLARLATSQVAVLANGFEGSDYNDIANYLQGLQTKLRGILKYMVIRAGEFMERMQEFIAQVGETQVAL
ncbi:hypothetical protein ACFL3J_00805 [Candidatus Omnitrophota bacterium]